MEHPYPNLVWNNEALRQQVLETELEAAKLRLEREKGNCPQCARFREKLDREKLAKVAYEHMFPDRYGWEKETDEHLLSNYRNLADHYIKYLTE